MNTTARTLTSIATAAASLAVGIVGARAMHSDDSGSASSAGDETAAVVVQGDIDTAYEQAVPVLGPVATGTGPIDFREVAASVEPGTILRSPEIGGVLTPTTDSAEPDDPPATTDTVPDETVDDDSVMVFDPSRGIIPLPDRVFDICAGPSAGGTPAEGCPTGYAGVLFSSHLPPEPQLLGTDGPQPISCPDDPAGAISVKSVTPLASLLFEWRPYGTSAPWQALPSIAPATPTAVREAWMARFEAEEYSLATFGYVPHCGIVVERDPNLPYEARLTAVDVFDRVVTATMVLSDATPEGRPPTTVHISDTDAVAQVRAYTKSGGSVTFATFTELSASYNPCLDADISRGALDASFVSSRDRGSSPFPGLYDPSFTRQADASVPLNPGDTKVLCVRIFDTSNTLRPLVTETIVLRGPEAWVPRVYLDGVVFAERAVVAGGDLQVSVGDSDDRCGYDTWVNDDSPLDGTELWLPEIHEWTCNGLTVLDGDIGTRHLTITTTRRVDGRRLTQTSALPIPLSDCFATLCGGDAFEEAYAVPIAPTASRICGQNFWESGPCLQPGEGYAAIRVEYRRRGGTGGGSAVLVASTERPITDPTAGTPIMRLGGGTMTNTDDWTALATTFAVNSDRPVTLDSLRIVGVEVPFGTDPACSAERTLPVGGGLATEFAIDTTICPGLLYGLWATVTNADGTVFDVAVGNAFVPVTGTDVQAQITFNGGDVPNFGWFYEFSSAIDGTTPAAGYGLRGVTGPPSARCHSLSDTSGTWVLPEVLVLGSRLEVSARVNITSGGERECTLDGRGAVGVLSVQGSFSHDQLRSGAPLTLTTPTDARLQMTITVDGDWQLGELQVDS